MQCDGIQRWILPIETNNLMDIIPVHPDSVGQFTGLCDMEGNRVFEGDIVDEVHFGFDGSEYLEQRIIEIDFSKTTDGIYPSFIKITGNTFQPE